MTAALQGIHGKRGQARLARTDPRCWSSSVRSRRRCCPLRRTSPGARTRGWSYETDQRKKAPASQSSLCLYRALCHQVRAGCAARLRARTFQQKALHIMEGFAAAFQSALPSFHPIDLCVGVAAAIAIRLAVYIKGKNAKKYRQECRIRVGALGQCRATSRPYVDPVFENNIILTQTERLTMNSRPKDPKTARNKNVLVVGGSGSRQDALFHQAKPHAVYLRRPAGFLRRHRPERRIVICEVGHLLQAQSSISIKVVNTINFKKSHAL